MFVSLIFNCVYSTLLQGRRPLSDMSANPQTVEFPPLPSGSNLDGKRPADYAVGLEMLQIFQEAVGGSQRIVASPGASAARAAVRKKTRRKTPLCRVTSLPAAF